MTEKEKIIEILNKSFMQKEVTPVFVADDGQETELPQELCEIFNDIVSQGAIPYFADALIAHGIGDVAEWKTRIAQLTAMKEYVDVERRYSVIRENESQKHIKLIEQERDKYKHRAEIAETELEKHKKALIDMCKEYENDVHCTYQDDSCEDECYMCAYNNRLRIAEREIEEESNKNAN